MQKKTTNKQHQLFINGKTENKQIFMASIDDLHFNKFNGRYRSEGIDKVGNPDSLEFLAEDEIMRFIESDRKDQNIRTMQSIEKHGIINPLVVTNTGIVLDGNRRLFCLKTLAKEGRLSYEGVESNLVPIIEIYENDWTPELIEKYESELQFVSEDKVAYTPLNRAIKIAQMLDVAKRNQKTESEALNSVSEAMGISITDVKKHTRIIRYIQDFLKGNGVEHYKFSWFEETNDQLLKLISYIENTVASQSSAESLKWYFSNEAVKNRLENNMMFHIVANVKSVGLIRDLLNSKKGILYKKDVFETWCNETENEIGRSTKYFFEQYFEGAFNRDMLIQTHKANLSKISEKALLAILTDGTQTQTISLKPSAVDGELTIGETPSKVFQPIVEAKNNGFTATRTKVGTWESFYSSANKFIEILLKQENIPNEKIDELIEKLNNYKNK